MMKINLTAFIFFVLMLCTGFIRDKDNLELWFGFGFYAIYILFFLVSYHIMILRGNRFDESFDYVEKLVNGIYKCKLSEKIYYRTKSVLNSDVKNQTRSEYNKKIVYPAISTYLLYMMYFSYKSFNAGGVDVLMDSKFLFILIAGALVVSYPVVLFSISVNSNE